MSSVTNDIIGMQNATASYNLAQKKNSVNTKTDKNDSNMFLTLMLKQLQHQDPTEPTDNTEWLSQLAQYSSLEQMADMNSNFKNCMSYMSAIYSDINSNAEITQTLSLIGKEVTIADPDNEGEKIIGKVSEASFEDGTGKIKVNDKFYSIANIITIKEPQAINQ